MESRSDEGPGPNSFFHTHACEKEENNYTLSVIDLEICGM